MAVEINGDAATLSTQVKQAIPHIKKKSHTNKKIEKDHLGLMGNYALLFIIIIFVMYSGCSAPPTPPEVHHAEVQKLALLKAAADVYTPDKYRNYTAAHMDAKDNFIKENAAKLQWFKDYTPVREQFRMLLGEGNTILATVKNIKEEKARNFEQRIASLRERVNSLKDSTAKINEGRLLRKSLSKAEVLLTEAGFLYKKGDYDTAEAKLNSVNTYALESMDIAHSILSRYMDKKQVEKWRKLVEETLAESRSKGIVVIIVSKIDQNLMVYKKGKKIETYDIGLGRNGLKDKLYSGDEGTPEGRYYIIKKNAGSRFYKALLFDYPNKEDRMRFDQAKKKGLIPARTGIGSLLEIHGGGSDGMTRGCISLEDKDMDRLFEIVKEGTPVTIVGAINGTYEMLSSIKDS
jgi:murein L,D-transpeptidase YafK